MRFTIIMLRFLRQKLTMKAVSALILFYENNPHYKGWIA